MRKLLLWVPALTLAVGAWAQDHRTGFPPYGSFEHGRFDAVNRQNLNVNFPIPVVSSPGRGQDFNFAIVYDSLIWKKNGSAWSPVTDSSGNPTWGWKKETPTGQTSYKRSTETCYMIDERGRKVPVIVARYYDYAYTDIVGTRHPFGLDFNTGEGLEYCPGASAPRTGPATDGSGFFIDANYPENPIIRPADGKEIVIAGVLTDTNGNYFSKIIVSSTETHWKDTVGRITLKIKKPSSTAIEYHVLAPTGGYPVTTMSLTYSSIKTNFACSGVTEYTGNSYLPTSISLPNGRSYSFEYEDTPGWPGYKTGRLKKVTLPTGGYYEYQYTGSNGGINCTDGTVKNMSRKINNGSTTVTWTFSRTQEGSNWKTTATAPQLPYDSSANQSTFTFDSDGKLISEKYYQGSSTLLRTINESWAANGTPSCSTIILENNQQSKTETVYDVYGNLTELREYDWGSGAPGAVIRTTQWTYLSSSEYTSRNIRDRVTQQIVRDGGPTGAIKSRTNTSYDEPAYSNTQCPTGVPQHDDAHYGCSFYTRGNPTTVTSYANPATPSGPVTRHSYYDFFGNIRREDVACCQQRQWNYSLTTKYAYPDEVLRGPAGGPQLSTSSTYNFHTGLVATSTDENNKVTTFTYDIHKRPTDVQRPDNAHITYSYDDVARIITVDNPVQGSDKRRQKTYFDGLGRQVKESVLDASNATYSIIETQYDPLSRAYKVSNPHNSTAQYWTENRFDALERPTMVIPPDGSPTSNRTVYSYSGNTTIVTDPTGKQHKTETDALGRVVKFYEPDVNNGNQLTQLTSYSYSVVDLLTQVSQGAQTRTFNYDGLGRLTSQPVPEAGTLSYQYNDFSLVTQRTDARGVVTTYSYDGLNRLTQVSYNTSGTTAVATPTVSFTYGTSPSLNNKGRLVSMTMSDNMGNESYEYDANMPWVKKVTKTIDAVPYVVQYAHNLAGEVTSITYPSARVVQQSYDVIGRLSQISSGATTYASGFGYNPPGQVTGFNYGNGVAASLGYSATRQQLTSLSYTKSGQTLFSFSYGYTQNGGNNGQITSITDNAEPGRTVNYTYDALRRLKTAVTNGSAAYPKWGLSWTYDRYGNRTAQTVTYGSAPSNSLTVSPTTNRITSSGFSYDAAGNMTNDALNSYNYDAENRIKQVNGGSTATYYYDGVGLRMKKVVGSTTTRYIFSGKKVIAEYVNGSLSKEYIYSGSQLLATHEGGSLKYHHAEHLSTRFFTDSAGNKVGERGHYSFGEVWYESGQTDKWKFTSYERGSESGLDYAINRYYNPRIGRFQTPDPCDLTTAACSGPAVSHRLFNSGQETPADTNRYPYVVNDPIDRTDPLGLQWECFPWDPWCWSPCPWWDPFCHRRWPRRRPRGDDGEWCPGWPGRTCWPGGGWGAGKEPPWVKDCSKEGKDRADCIGCCEENVQEETKECIRRWWWEPHALLTCLIRVEIWERRCYKDCDANFPLPPKPKPPTVTNHLFRGISP